MALLNIKGEFSAIHGTRKRVESKFSVDVFIKGRIKGDFVEGIDHKKPSKALNSLLKELGGKYLDDIVGRATNENIAEFIIHRLSEFPVSSVRICEDSHFGVEVFAEEASLEDFPARLLYRRAQSLLHRENPKKASKLLSEAITLSPGFAEAFNLRGRCFKYLNDWDRALEDFKKAIKLNPRLGDAFRNLGNAYYYTGQYKLMVPAFSKAVKLMPDSALAFNNRGFALQKLGRFKQALKDHSKAVRLDSCYAEAFKDRGKAYLALGRKKLAEKDFERQRVLEKTGTDSYHGVRMY